MYTRGSLMLAINNLLVISRRRLSPLRAVQMSRGRKLHLYPVPLRRSPGLSRRVRRGFPTMYGSKKAPRRGDREFPEIAPRQSRAQLFRKTLWEQSKGRSQAPGRGGQSRNSAIR